MYRLRHQDSRLILTALKELNSDVDPRSLPQRAIATLDTVIGNELSNFDFFSPDGRYNLTAWTSRNDIMNSDVLENFKRFIHQHPAIPMAIADSSGKPFKLTDGATSAEFERTELYNEYFRKIDIDHQMGLAMPIANDLTVCCAVARGGRNFTERERTLLGLTAPHLLNSLRGAVAYNRLNSALENARTGVISVDSAGRPVFVSDFARILLEKYFAGVRRGHEIPESLHRWISTLVALTNMDEFRMPTTPLVVENELGLLRVRWIENVLSHDFTLLLEEKRHVDYAALDELNLTSRESEILTWIAKGKSDDAISTLCDISIRTVQKHVENIYRKLGVETRTAAMLRAIESF